MAPESKTSSAPTPHTPTTSLAHPPKPQAAGDLPSIETMQQALERAQHASSETTPKNTPPAEPPAAPKAAEPAAPKAPPPVPLPPPHIAAPSVPAQAPATPVAAPRTLQPSATEPPQSRPPAPPAPLPKPEIPLAPKPIPSIPAEPSAPAPKPPAQPAPTMSASAAIKPVPPSVDLHKIVLPTKKSGPSLLSAERVNAALVLEASQKPLPRTVPAAPDPTLGAHTEYAHDTTPTLHTYQTDVEDATRKEHLSLARIAAAESERAAQAAQIKTEPKKHDEWLGRFLELSASALFIVLALALIAFVATRTPIIPHPLSHSTPFVYVDDTENVAVAPGETGPQLLTSLAARAARLTLSVGLVERFYLYTDGSATSSARELSTQDFLARIAPGAPASLGRSLSPTFLIGTHSFAGNLPFLVFKTDPASYDQAYAAMLQWEPDMARDLAPLLQTATSSTATSTAHILATPFADATIANHDARVLKDERGTTILLWSFVDRSTLIIATDAHTLSELISRLTQAPTVPSLGK